VTRARIVLAAATGEPNSEIAKRLQLTRATIGKWRARFLERRINGLYDELRPGKPRTIDDERVAELIKTTLHTKPADGSTHWSVRAVAAQTSISPTSVHRYFKLLGLQPHRSETFKLSTDAFFIEKLRDVVGLYLNPENALVLCVDEKSQCQALERTQPMLPMGLGYVEGVTHVTAQRLCLPRRTYLTVRCWPSASRVIGTKSSSLSCARSTRPFPPSSMCIASWITTAAISTPRSRRGWQPVRAGTCISSPPTVPG
jgi:transposase